MELKAIDDGHKPAIVKDVDTQLAFQTKHSSNFIEIKDNVLPQSWLERSYSYCKNSKPWGNFALIFEYSDHIYIKINIGAYVTVVDIKDVTIDLESLWNVDPQKAISLVAARALLVGARKDEDLVYKRLGDIEGR